MEWEKHFRRWMPMLLVVGFLLAITTLTLAREPTPPEPGESPAAPEGPQLGVPRHRPGHLAKVDNLDVLLAEGRLPDPLAANRTLVNWDKILLVFEGDYEGPKFVTKPYDVDADLGDPTSRYYRRPHGADMPHGGNMDVAAGYLSDPLGWSDTVAAWENAQGSVSLYLAGYNNELWPKDEMPPSPGELDTGEPVQGRALSSNFNVPYGGLIRLATGDFDGDGYDEFVLGWEGPGQSLNLKVYDTDRGLTPTARGRIADEKLGGWKWFDVATGDFDGDGDAEIAVAWQGDTKQLSVKVYDVGRDGSLTAEARLVEALNSHQVSVATGDLNGDRVDEIAVGFNTEAQAHLYLYQPSDNLHTLTAKGMFSVASGFGGNTNQEVGREIGVGAGDFSADGIDELVLVYARQEDYHCNVTVFAADEDLKLLEKVTLDTKELQLPVRMTGYDQLSLAVGDMNRDVKSEIVAGWQGFQAGSAIVIALFQVDPDLLAIRMKGHTMGEHVITAEHQAGHLALAVGGFDGKSVHVGLPTYSRMAEVKEVLAVINAPPKHRDVIGRETYDVNVTDTCPDGPPCTYAKYETEEKTSTKMGLTTTRDWGVSTEADLKFGFVKSSLSASYGESFEKTTTSFKTKEFGQDVLADRDDAIVRIEQDLNVWEYPVYADGSDAVQGYIQVVWPEKVDPSCSKNCEAALTARIDGKNPISYYEPNHEVNNVLSYPIQAPSDISTTIKADIRNYLAANPYQMWVKWSDVEDSESKKSSKMDLKESLKASKFGQSIEEKGEYSHGEVSVNEVSFETSTSIHLYFWGIEPKYSYGVRPFFYWAKPDGRLVLDYVVSPLTADLPTWWQTTYDKPDPAFNLPWKDGEQGEAYKLLTKEITFDPASPTDGEKVKVRAKVRNYSLLGVNNVPVRFYAGDPDHWLHRGVLFGQTTIATIPAMSAIETEVEFDTSGYSGQTLDIYAVIDRKGTIKEMHTDNNKAYAQLPVVPPGDSDRPTTLAVIPDNITFDPERPAAGEAVRIAASVQASGDTFTHVAVEFWAGQPDRGGRWIGGRVIPMILAGETGLAEMVWDTTGLGGSHEIWVVIHRHVDEDDTTDNRAHKVLNLEPYRRYLPAVWKD